MYMQQLIKEHADRTSFLYDFLADKMRKDKISRQKGAENVKIKEGDQIYSKLVNKRRGKDKPRYEKALVIGEVERNVVPIQVRERVTKVPVRNVKRPTN